MKTITATTPITGKVANKRLRRYAIVDSVKVTCQASKPMEGRPKVFQTL
jgi:hypothetical protein